MADEPLRQLFAALTFKADLSSLTRVNRAVDKTKAVATQTTSSFSSIGTAVSNSLGSIFGAVSKVRQQAFQPLSRDSKKLTESLKGTFPALASALAVGSVIGLSRELMNAADESDELSTALGMTVEEIQSLQMFAKIGSVDAGSLSKGLRTMAKAVGEFRTSGKGKGADLFQQLGIVDTIKQGGTLEETFYLIGNAIAKIDDDTVKLAASQKIFGTAGVSLITAFANGEEDIAKVRERIKKIGPIYDKEFAGNAAAFNDELDFTKYSALGLFSTLLGKLLPGIRKVSEMLFKGTSAVSKYTKETKILEAALAMLVSRWLGGFLAAKLSFLTSGLYGASQGMLILGKASLAAMRSFFWIATIAILLEDLIGWINGSDSATGRFIDSIYGAGKSVETLKGLKEWWASIGPSIKSGTATAITAIGGFTKSLIQLMNAYKTSGDERKKWEDGFAASDSGIMKWIDGVIKKLADFIFMVDDAYMNVSAKLRKLDPSNWFKQGAEGAGWASGKDPKDAMDQIRRNMGLPTSGPAKALGGTVSTSKTLTLNDQRTNQFNFGNTNMTPIEVKKTVVMSQDTDRSKTAAAFGLI